MGTSLRSWTDAGSNPVGDATTITTMLTLGTWLGPIIAAVIAVVGIPAGLRLRFRRGHAIERIAAELARQASAGNDEQCPVGLSGSLVAGRMLRESRTPQKTYPRPIILCELSSGGTCSAAGVSPEAEDRRFDPCWKRSHGQDTYNSKAACPSG